MMRLLVFLFLFALSAIDMAEAKICYVRDGGTATGSNGCDSVGARDWSNNAHVYDQLSSAIAVISRGDTIFVADGAYGGVSLNTAALNTTPITICKAVATLPSTGSSCGSAHGTSLGWSDTMGNGQATWVGSAGVTFSTANWVFDGVIGNGSTSLGTAFQAGTGGDITTYGFRFSGGSSVQGIIKVNSSDIAIKHTAVQCPFSQSSSEYGISNPVNTGARMSISYGFMDGCQVAVFGQESDQTFEYMYFGRNWSTGSAHGVTIETKDRTIVRFSYFLTCSIQCIEPSGNTTQGINGGFFYGNIITNLVPNANNGNNNATNGFAKGVASGNISNSVFYNNTMINSEGPLLYESNVGGGIGNVVRNNLCYLCTGSFVIEDGAGPVTHSHNWMVDSTAYTDTNGQVSSGDPFVNWTSGDFHLDGSPASQAGFTLPAPYNVDMLGNIRTTWTRGAIEFVSGSDTTPPSDVSGLSATGGDQQVILNWSAATDNVGVTGYNIESCSGVGCVNFTPLISVGTVTTYTNTGLAFSTTYRYRIKARDAANNLSVNWSAIATAATNPPPASPTWSPIMNLRVAFLQMLDWIMDWIEPESASAASLTWDYDTTNGKVIPSSAMVEYSLSASGPWTLKSTVPSLPSSYQLDATYGYYRVTNVAGSSNVVQYVAPPPPPSQTLEDRVVSLEKSMSALQAKVAGLETAVMGLQNALNTTIASVQAIQANVSVLVDQRNKLKAGLCALKGNSLTKDVQAERAALGGCP